ncbi:kinase inhibitor [Gemmatimonadetes bacterium T265]|nr:kinase inhibitor [Gemmatimonadetes bacterium T265]
MTVAAASTLLAAAAAAQAAPARTAPAAAHYDVRSPAMPRAGFVLTSADAPANGRLTEREVANTFGCSGQNVSPALSWTGAPAGTKSFAVTVYDPDAPTGSGFWHWLVYNLPATTTSLPAGAGSQGGTLPAGAVQATTDYGAPGYGGPCPPKGDGPHRYIFTVHALKVDRLDLPATGTAAVVGFNLHANALATASFTARYAR